MEWSADSVPPTLLLLLFLLHLHLLGLNSDYDLAAFMEIYQPATC